MGFLDRAIRRGISDAVGKAVGEAVKDAVKPTAEKYANQAASRIDEAAGQMDRAAGEVTTSTGEVKKQSTGLEGAFSNLQRSMEGYATEMSKNLKICPSCGEGASADKQFCPSCGAKLPEQTVAEGAICTKCGAQNTIGTKFCASCGEKLPGAIAEEQAVADKDAVVLAQWESKLPAYPKWDCGGTEFSYYEDVGFVDFSAVFENNRAAMVAVEKYRALAKANGFMQAGEYPSDEHLYKKVGATCYHIDTEHCFEGDSYRPCIYFNNEEPVGGFDYKKPEPKKKSGLFGLF